MPATPETAGDFAEPPAAPEWRVLFVSQSSFTRPMHFYSCKKCGNFGQSDDSSRCPACGAWLVLGDLHSTVLPTLTSRTWVAVCYLILGFALGLLTNLCSFGLAGAGHGWFTPARISWITLFGAPLSALAWVYRSHNFGLYLARGLLVVMLIANVLLIVMALAEDPDHFKRIWSAGQIAVLAWGAMWLLWQQVTIACLIVNKRRPPETNTGLDGNWIRNDGRPSG